MPWASRGDELSVGLLEALRGSADIARRWTPAEFKGQLLTPEGDLALRLLGRCGVQRGGAQHQPVFEWASTTHTRAHLQHTPRRWWPGSRYLQGRSSSPEVHECDGESSSAAAGSASHGTLVPSSFPELLFVFG